MYRCRGNVERVPASVAGNRYFRRACAVRQSTAEQQQTAHQGNAADCERCYNRAMIPTHTTLQRLNQSYGSAEGRASS